jgi:chemotaxis protein MotA
MVLVIGFVIVCASVVLGLKLGGGSVLVLLHLSEFVVVLGICAGLMVIASPLSVLKAVVAKTIVALKGGPCSKASYMEAMKMMYHIFMLARKEGLMVLEDHLSDPKSSDVFKNYPMFLRNQEAVDFVVDALRPLVDGRIKPEQLKPVLSTQLAAFKDEAHKPVGILGLVGDSFPGVGICAAVLGIILTMGSVAEGPVVVGKKVAAALTGTFLGVFGAYGFINPLAALIQTNNEAEGRYFNMIAEGIVGYANGLAPQISIEFARRTLLSNERPSSDELEAALKEVKLT